MRKVHSKNPQTNCIVNLIQNGQILFEGKARFGSKTERTRQYASILKRIATHPSGKRWAFGIKFYQPASFFRDFSVNTRQVFRVAFTFSPVIALAANEGTLS